VAGVGTTQGTLTPGYWYYENKTSSVTSGTWKPLGGQVNQLALTSPTAPAGNTAGQVAYNTSATAPTGLIYWDGTQWKPVGSPSAADVTAASNKVTLGGTPTGAALKAFSVDVNEANLTLGNMGGSLPASKITPAGTAGQILTSNGTGSAPTWKDAASTDATAADLTKDAWIDDAANTMVKLGTLANGSTTRPAGTEFVALDNGYVGIGTNNPTRRLHIVGTGTGNSGMQITGYSSNPVILLEQAGGTSSAPSMLNAGSILGSINFRSWDGTTFVNSSLIQSFASENHSATAQGSFLQFATTANSTASALPRMVIDNKGYVGINTLTPATLLEINNGGINGAIKIVDGTQGTGKVLTSDANGVGTWQAPIVITVPVKTLGTDVYPHSAYLTSTESILYTITAPSTGLYLVNASTCAFNATSNKTGTVKYRFYRNGVNFGLQYFASPSPYIPGAGFCLASIGMSDFIALTAGDVVTVTGVITHGDNTTLAHHTNGNIMIIRIN
jgi:hypothetical protein